MSSCANKLPEFQISQIGIPIFWLSRHRNFKKKTDRNLRNRNRNRNSASDGGPRNWNQKSEFPTNPLDPESSRTLIVLFLTFSPELTLGLGILAWSECVFSLFSSKLVLFSSNFFNLGTNFFGIWPFLVFWETHLGPQQYSPESWHFLPFGEKASYFWD